MHIKLLELHSVHATVLPQIINSHRSFFYAAMAMAPHDTKADWSM